MTVNPFELLSTRIKKIIFEMRWESLTPVQELAIPAVLTGNQHIIISAETASGKTEAAFLPVLSRIEDTATERLKVLYISPLRALINDQFERIETLCKYTDIPVHKWHGDVATQQKRQFVSEPAGILQITPESLEAIFVNRAGSLRKLFADIEFVIIDEIHAFLGRDRGVHLQSLLSRMEWYTQKPPRILALSATLGDMEGVKRWIDPVCPETVCVVSTTEERTETLFALDYEEKRDEQIPNRIVQDIRALTKEYSAMIFCNSRFQAEELGVHLNELAALEYHGCSGFQHYFIHHSSIDRKEREYVEQTMRSATNPCSVICTSSLELGIDIGPVDLVIQVDATWSVSSLKQRVGRSGRRRGKARIVQMYADDAMGLLQAIAVTELMREGWVEAAEEYPIPYDILFHQMLSICAERNGITTQKLVNILQALRPFVGIPAEAILQLLEHVYAHDFLELIGHDQWIVGWKCEQLLRSPEFYAIFQTPKVYHVFDGERPVGTVEKNAWIDIGAHILLAGRMWKIDTVDDANLTIRVVPATHGSPPRYSGMAVKRGHPIAKKMAQILFSQDEYPYLMPNTKRQLTLLRSQLALENLQVTAVHRLVEHRFAGSYVFQMFAGTDIQRTFVWMVRALGEKARMNESGHIELDLQHHSFLELYRILLTKCWEEDMLLPWIHAHERFQSKYSVYLPQSFRERMHLSSEVDIAGTLQYLQEIIPYEI